MKVIIQIPAYNEEASLPIAVNALPKTLMGVDHVEWLVIDDGSSDRTAEVAKELGVHHIVRQPHNMGLAKGFMAGISECLSQGADIIVNTDADNQYYAPDIQKLIDPILDGSAQIVIGERPISQTKHFSIVKKFLQKFGSLMVRVLSGTSVQDAPSGFRAYSKNAAIKLNVFNNYTYTLETIIQAGRTGIPVKSVPIRTNEDLRPSRLVKSIRSYVTQSMFTMLRVITTYSPLKVFFLLGSLPFISGVVLVGRWFIYWYGVTPASHLPSLVLGVTLVGIGIQLFIFGLIADLISVNRRLLEDIQLKVRHWWVDKK